MTVTVVEGDVVILGPDAIGVSLTPEAAEESGRRLQQAATQARLPQEEGSEHDKMA
jgi:hypothetical protein